MRLEAWFKRRTAACDRPRARVFAALFVPLLFGLISVYMGQDANWDLRNYHWYNAYALLNGRLDMDMAPAQFQSYFNPAIDIPYYLLAHALPGPAVGFAMGFVHGLNFVLLVAIARALVGCAGATPRLPLLLAAAGVCGAGFLSELGNTMGDNLTSLLVLSSLLLVLRGWEQLAVPSGRTLGRLLASGVLMGLGVGLKLTNATYAVALCAALLTVPVAPARRLALAFALGCGVLAGLLASAGYWWAILWERFGNPLFPQFNHIFRSPLAQRVGELDTAHLPHNLFEAAFWPFVFMADFKRVGEISLKPLLMPVLYAAALAFVGKWVAERLTGTGEQARSRLSPQGRFLLVFGLVAYLAWMKLFSIYRYLVPLELLAPLMFWLLAHRLAAPRHAARFGGWILAVATLATFPVMSWGHAEWGDTNFSAQFPSFAQPASTIVFTAHGDPPMGWLAAFVDPQVRVVALGGGFPESPAYVERIQAAIAGRPGPHYVMLAGARNDKEGGLHRKLAVADALGMTATADRCQRLDGLLHRVRFQVQVKFQAQAGRQCTLELQPQYRMDLNAQDHAKLEAGRATLARYGLQIAESGCKHYPAAIGKDAFSFRLCSVTRQRRTPSAPSLDGAAALSRFPAPPPAPRAAADPRPATADGPAAG